MIETRVKRKIPKTPTHREKKGQFSTLQWIYWIVTGNVGEAVSCVQEITADPDRGLGLVAPDGCPSQKLDLGTMRPFGDSGA